MSMNKPSRREFLKILGIGAAALSLPGFSSCEKTIQSKTPNIILIMADDLGYGDLGCYGNPDIQSPNLDALARGGIRFTDFHSNGAVCSPTRAALLTGLYQQRCGIEAVVTAANHRDKGMALSEITFAEVLKNSGYRTALFGKWHLGYQVGFNPTKQGFDEFRGFVSGNIDYQSHIDQVGFEDWWMGDKLIPEKGYSTHLITEHGLKFIKENKNNPFCLYLAHEAPHYPFQGPNDDADRTPGNPHPISGKREDRDIAYREMIKAMDDGIGRIIQEIKDCGIERNTFIFFCSDNGPGSSGSAGALKGGKGSLWEGGHRVPAIAYWPGKIISESVIDETIMTMDLFPTMLAISGMPPYYQKKFDGFDFSPILFSENKLPERSLFWRHGSSKAVRKGPWKLIDNQLYNLEIDLGEENNIIKDFPDKAKELQTEYLNWEKEVTAGIERLT